jgi:hypothetical protein
MTSVITPEIPFWRKQFLRIFTEPLSGVARMRIAIHTSKVWAKSRMLQSVKPISDKEITRPDSEAYRASKGVHEFVRRAAVARSMGHAVDAAALDWVRLRAGNLRHSDGETCGVRGPSYTPAGPAVVEMM